MIRVWHGGGQLKSVLMRPTPQLPVKTCMGEGGAVGAGGVTYKDRARPPPPPPPPWGVGGGILGWKGRGPGWNCSVAMHCPKCGTHGRGAQLVGTQIHETPQTRASFEQGGGGRGFWTQNLVYQKWPDQIFPIVNFVFSHYGHFGLGRGGGGFGGGVPPPFGF